MLVRNPFERVEQEVVADRGAEFLQTFASLDLANIINLLIIVVAIWVTVKIGSSIAKVIGIAIMIYFGYLFLT